LQPWLGARQQEFGRHAYLAVRRHAVGSLERQMLSVPRVVLLEFGVRWIYTLARNAPLLSKRVPEVQNF